MATVTLNLPAETERKLRDRTEKAGMSFETLVRDLVFEAANAPRPWPRFVSEPKLTDEQFDQWINEISAGATASPLPPDFSREDIYFDHD
jgi:hypothetical protein